MSPRTWLERIEDILVCAHNIQDFRKAPVFNRRLVCYLQREDLFWGFYRNNPRSVLAENNPLVGFLKRSRKWLRNFMQVACKWGN